jgi:uncharacterized protein YkwD
MAYTFCPYCGAARSDPAWCFCPYCGGRLPEASGENRPAAPAAGLRSRIPAPLFAAGILLVLIFAAVLVQAFALHLVPAPVAADTGASPSPAATAGAPVPADTSAPAAMPETTPPDLNSTGNSTRPAAPASTTRTVPSLLRTPAFAGPVITVTGTPPYPYQAPAMGSSEEVPVIEAPSLAARVHELVNTIRQENGLPALGTDTVLASIALAHSKDMAAQEYFSHTNLHGMDPTARGAAAGYTCRKDDDAYYASSIAENLYATGRYSAILFMKGRAVSYNWNTEEKIAQLTVTGWMNSTGHRENILDRNLQREGIGVAIGEDDLVYITEDLC